jgi:hypothetical protein
MNAIRLAAATAATTVFAGLASAAPAQAKLACYHLKQIEQALGAEYGEKQTFAGREAKTGEAIEYRLYVNAETGSWSWVGIPAGTEVGCLIFAGTLPDRRDPPDAGKPDSAAPSSLPSRTPQAQF